MKSLRSFLLAESRMNEGDEPAPKPKPKIDDNVPEGYRKGSVKGKISKAGMEVMKQIAGETPEGKPVHFKNFNVADKDKIKKAAGFGGVDDLKSLVGENGMFSSSDGAEKLQQVFRGSAVAASVSPGASGYALTLADGWEKLAGRGPSSEKVLMFWVNTLYNVYVENSNTESTTLKFYFSAGNKNVIVQEP